ncbi:hypothetical protein FGO68_gene13632 [Halteria grandinella]|uniref:Uncharacterized protein n=1 Tax=Halteria grandinella TaxID=5974 RepID=A0A8J8SZE3_HALGN|nr:hypothetical protein FGO68_gene13632 [Halteria grandinella]
MQGPAPAQSPNFKAKRSNNSTPNESFKDDTLPEQKMTIESEDLKTMQRMKRSRTFEESQDRMGFIRKVLGILTAQLVLTSLITFAPTYDATLRLWLREHPSLLWTCFALTLATQCCILCVRELARKVPLNYILLLTFTLSESYVVAFITTEYSPESVLMAAGMTAGVTIGLTVYAVRSEHDFTMAGGALFIIGAIFCTCGLMLAVCNVNRESLVFMIYSAVAVLLFGFYLIYDIQLIIGGGRYELDDDEYIIGALIVYLDIIMLFIHILELVGKKR